jgi:hypothetical protein
MRIFNTFFTNEVATSYAGRSVLFITDIRRVPGHARQDRNTEIRRLKDDDHEWQRAWVEIMRPRASMLKFAPPYDEGKKVYFDGYVRSQAFAPRASTETRLIFCCDAAGNPIEHWPRGSGGVFPTFEYNCKIFEDVGAYFNNVTRVQCLTQDAFLQYHMLGVDGRVIAQATGCPQVAWTLYNGLPRYDDWRAMQIMTTHYLTTLCTEIVPQTAHFDAFATPATEMQIQNAIKEGLKALARVGKFLGGTQITQARKLLNRHD